MENSDIFSSLKRKSIFSSSKRKMASYSNSQADVVEIYTGDMKFPEDLSDGCGRSDASTQTSDRRSTDLSDGWSRSDVSMPRRSEDGDERDRSVTSSHTPKRRSADTAPFDAPARKVVRRGFYFSPGRDIRRNLFVDTDSEMIQSFSKIPWAILRVDAIQTSADHSCIRRLYVGDMDGRFFAELEFYPCVAYRHLPEKYREKFEVEKRTDHRLSYNPMKKTLPCRCAIPKVNDYIMTTGVEIMLYSSLGCDRKVESDICKYLDFPCMDIYNN